LKTLAVDPGSAVAVRFVRPAPRVLLIGQGPSRRRPRGARAFDGPGAGAHLAKLAGVPQAELLRRVRAVNLLKTWRGKAGKGDRFPMAAARRAAAKLYSSKLYHEADVVVFVGDAVARAFGVGRLKPCGIYWGWAAKLPHPSGVNRWYNEQANRDLASRFLRDLIGGA
jgi:uracil-DNA glycosylase